MPAWSKHNRRPGGPRDHRIEQRDQARAAIEHRQFHGQRLGLPDFHARRRVFLQALPVRLIQRSGFHQQAAAHAALPRLLHQLLVQRIHRVGRARKFQVLAAGPRRASAVLDRGLPGVADDAQVIQRSAPALAFRISARQVVDHPSAMRVWSRQLALQHCARRAR